jgi:hypothetical protein
MQKSASPGGMRFPTTLFARGSNEVLFYKVEAPWVTTEVEPSGRRMGDTAPRESKLIVIGTTFVQ